MRKFDNAILLTVLTLILGLTMLIVFLTPKPSTITYNIPNQPSVNVQQVKSAELIWETLSRHFISPPSTR